MTLSANKVALNFKYFLSSSLALRQHQHLGTGRRFGRFGVYTIAALMVALCVGQTAQAQENGKVFYGCDLGNNTTKSLNTDMERAGIQSGDAQIVIVLNVDNPDGGQLVDDSVTPNIFTAAVVCVAKDVLVELVGQQDEIGSTTEPIDILDSKQFFFVTTQETGTTNRELRMCAEGRKDVDCAQFDAKE